jgi:DNA-binding winged helix-turn-helix (wHTH) protein
MPTMSSLKFGHLIFDPASRRLWRNEEEVHLSPKAFDLLRLLIERRPEAVSKNEIRAHLWPDTYVSETNLPSLMTEIREALGEDASHPRFIRTLHRFGYAFEGEALADAVRQKEVRGWLIADDARLALYTGANILGREGPDVVVVPSSTASRRHARIVIDEEGASVEDLGSKNGTYVNDQPVISPIPLRDGDQVRLGSLVLAYSTRPSHSGSETQTRTSSVETPPL